MRKPFSKLLGLATGAYATRRSISGGPGHVGPATGHFDGEVFRNQNPDASAGKNLGEFLRWQRTSRPARWPKWVENRATPDFPASLEQRDFAVTFINHITFLIQFRGLNVLTDPVYSERVSPVDWTGPKRVRAPGLPFEQLPEVHVVLVSHNHYDHLDLETLKRLHRGHSPVFLTGLGNEAFLTEHGLGRVKELDWWQEARERGARFTYTPAQHWSGRGLSGRNRTLWGGFVIEADGRRVFFAGDTGYWRHFKEVRQRCGVMDLALLPIGAYEPRWFMADQHMNPDEAVRAHKDLEAELSIGTHFGCFQLTDEEIDAPVKELEVARRKRRVDPDSFLALETGQTLLVPAEPGEVMERVEIFRSYHRSSCEERAFVLHAVGIESDLAWNGRTWSLIVDSERTSAAISHLLRYENENPPRRLPPPEEPRDRFAWMGSAAYVAVMLAAGFLAGRRAFALDWFGAGALHTAAVRSGEVWRAVTALTLHADLGHLLANLGFGAFFGLLAGQLLGPGVAWFCVLVAAVAANLFNSMIQQPQYVSVGASTAVFATLGLLAAYAWRRRAGTDGRRVYRWAPLVAGVALLGFMGIGGERTDVLAHLTGFVTGILAGSALSLLPKRPGTRIQSILGAASLGMIFLAWLAALSGA